MNKIILKENGEDVSYDVLFTVKDEKKNREFIIYTGDSEYIYAALYIDGEINYIDDVKDQKFINDIIDIVKKEVE